MSRQSSAFFIKLIHSPLRISCHAWKWAEMGQFFGKMDLLLCWDEISQQSWTKNMQTKCHRLLDKILQWDGLSHRDKLSKFTRSECHDLGWMDNLSTLRRNVTVVNCHSRWIIGWTLSLGWNVGWSVCEWTDHLGTPGTLSSWMCSRPTLWEPVDAY